ncbi:MAG: hypothetical protein ACLQIJ_04015 [Polyangia bacterium]
MITKTSLVRALLLVDKDKRATQPFACPTTPGWLWAGPWAVRSDKMVAARVEGGEVAVTSAAILRDASALPNDLRNRLALRDGPRESSDGKVSLYVLSRPAGGARDLVGVDARLWSLLEGLALWGDGPREPVAGFKDGQFTALVMPRILSEADKDPAPPGPLQDRVRDACQAATDALVTHYNPAKALEAFDVTGAAESLVERHALKIVRTPGLAAELRTIIGACQAPAWIVDKTRYAEMMRKRSSRAGDFHTKVCGHLDRAESAELKRASAARKVLS